VCKKLKKRLSNAAKKKGDHFGREIAKKKGEPQDLKTETESRTNGNTEMCAGERGLLMRN